MKKNLLKSLMLFAAFAFSINLNAQIPGETCVDPLAITSLPYSSSDTLSKYGDAYGLGDVAPVASNAVTIGSGSEYYIDGYDAVYSYTPANNETINIETTLAQSGWHSLWVFEGCPFNSTVAYHVATSGTSRTVTGLPVTAGQTYYIVVSDWDLEEVHYDIDIYADVACSGMPSAGTITGPIDACVGADVELVGSDVLESGIGFQWQESTDGITWTDIAGATSFTYTVVGGISADTYYRLEVTCTPTGDVDTSNEIMVQSTSGAACLCIPTGGSNNGDEIRNFTLNNLNNSSASNEGTNGYSDYTATVTPADLEIGVPYVAQLTSGTGSGSHGVAVWIDFNDNGAFEASELITSLPASVTANQTVDLPSFVVPIATPLGQHRLRVQYTYNKAGAVLDPCHTTTSYSETEDYLVNVLPEPTCLPPNTITSSNITSTSLDLGWTELGTATTWNIEYGPVGYTQGSGTPVPANSNPFTITGLNPSTQYDFYVQSECSSVDQSTWSGPYTTYTACGIAVAPFYEGFNNAVQPQCWDNLSSDPSSSSNNSWNFNSQGDYAAANNGKNAGEFTKVDGNSPYADSVMLITPEIDISQLTNPYLSFEWFSNNTNNPGDNVPMIIELYDGTSWNYLDTLSGDSPDWEFVNFDLNAYSNNIIQIRFMVNKSVTTSYSYYNDILLDEVRIDDCSDLGGTDGTFNVCRLDNTIDLNDNIIVKPNGGGEWSFPEQPANLTQDSILNVTYLPAGSYEAFYVERGVCYDTTFATINVFNQSSAGTDGTLSVCKNEPINLFDALTGTIDMGGNWYDFSGTLLTNSQPKAANIPGQYNFTYIASNGVCPADTAIVEVGVKPDCDFLSLSEELFNDISVYPNPATSQLNIVNPSNTNALKVEMLDMNGRIVLVENKALNDASKATLVIDHLEKGIYTLRVYNDEGQKTFKVVKQ